MENQTNEYIHLGFVTRIKHYNLIFHFNSIEIASTNPFDLLVDDDNIDVSVPVKKTTVIQALMKANGHSGDPLFWSHVERVLSSLLQLKSVPLHGAFLSSFLPGYRSHENNMSSHNGMDFIRFRDDFQEHKSVPLLAQRLKQHFTNFQNMYGNDEYPIGEMSEKIMRDTVKDENDMVYQASIRLKSIS